MTAPAMSVSREYHGRKSETRSSTPPAGAIRSLALPAGSLPRCQAAATAVPEGSSNPAATSSRMPSIASVAASGNGRRGSPRRSSVPGRSGRASAPRCPRACWPAPGSAAGTRPSPTPQALDDVVVVRLEAHLRLEARRPAGRLLEAAAGVAGRPPGSTSRRPRSWSRTRGLWASGCPSGSARYIGSSTSGCSSIPP